MDSFLTSTLFRQLVRLYAQIAVTKAKKPFVTVFFFDYSAAWARQYREDEAR
jgi:hypothetical protein